MTIIGNVKTSLMALGVVVLTGISSQVQAQTAAAPSVCPDNLSRYSALTPGQALRCTCLPSQLKGSVWGSGRYTLDSSVCRAAQHAGAITASGGQIAVYKSPGCARFVGNVRNGVTSRSWGPYSQSFGFNWPAASCAPTGAVAAKACPATMRAFSGMAPGQKLTCTCSPQQLGGSIWGSMRYTTDSSTCGAAVHAGAIPASGGKVTVRTTDGCKRFAGASRNNMKSRSWGSYTRSFYFGGKTPACAK